MTPKPARPWFTYRRAPGKMSATPASAAGWAALIGFVLLVVVIGRVATAAMRGWHPIAVVAVLLPGVAAAVVAFLRWVVIPRGREDQAAPR